MQQQRLTRELSKMTSVPPTGINIYPKDDKLTNLEAQIIGPEDTPYRGGVFRLEIFIPEQYPFRPPLIRFITKVYHPNIDENGRICLDLLKMPPKGNWRPTIGLEGLLVAVRMLLESPNPEDPLVVEIADEYLKSKAEYLRKAQYYTNTFAK